MQPQQNYKNHLRYHAPYHFVFLPVSLCLIIFASYKSISSSENNLIWLMLTLLFILLAFSTVMMRQHYALNNQNRTVRLELRLRYYILTQKRFEVIEHKLALSQLFALRFAPDEELVALIERAVNENLSGDEIKRAIKNWLPDLMRV